MMKSRILKFMTAMTLFTALAMPSRLFAQHTRYKFIDWRQQPIESERGE